MFLNRYNSRIKLNLDAYGSKSGFQLYQPFRAVMAVIVILGLAIVLFKHPGDFQFELGPEGLKVEMNGISM